MYHILVSKYGPILSPSSLMSLERDRGAPLASVPLRYSIGETQSCDRPWVHSGHTSALGTWVPRHRLEFWPGAAGLQPAGGMGYPTLECMPIEAPGLVLTTTPLQASELKSRHLGVVKKPRAALCPQSNLQKP